MLEWAIGTYRRLRDWIQGREYHERLRELIGTSLAHQVALRERVSSLGDIEFRVHSQFGDDGIVQWLISQLPNLPRRFVEFGVEDYSEANTRFLMVNNHWSGLVMDGSKANINRLRNRPWFWRHDLTAQAEFLTRDNVDRLIAGWSRGQEIGLIHVDVDGNDYWLWEAIESAAPGIMIMEYNALFGPERAITVPYRADFRRLLAHPSGQYFGASLAALTHLANHKGYALIGTNTAGNNAYFIRRDLLTDLLRGLSTTTTWSEPSFRDSRDGRGQLDFSTFEARQAVLRGLTVINVLTGQAEPF